MFTTDLHPQLAATVTGVPALLIILAVLALLVIGTIAIVRFIARRARE